MIELDDSYEDKHNAETVPNSSHVESKPRDVDGGVPSIGSQSTDDNSQDSVSKVSSVGSQPAEADSQGSVSSDGPHSQISKNDSMEVCGLVGHSPNSSDKVASEGSRDSRKSSTNCDDKSSFLSLVQKSAEGLPHSESSICDNTVQSVPNSFKDEVGPKTVKNITEDGKIDSKCSDNDLLLQSSDIECNKTDKNNDLDVREEDEERLLALDEDSSSHQSCSDGKKSPCGDVAEDSKPGEQEQAMEVEESCDKEVEDPGLKEKEKSIDCLKEKIDTDAEVKEENKDSVKREIESLVSLTQGSEKEKDKDVSEDEDNKSSVKSENGMETDVEVKVEGDNSDRKRPADTEATSAEPKRSRLDMVIGKLGSQIGISLDSLPDEDDESDDSITDSATESTTPTSAETEEEEDEKRSPRKKKKHEKRSIRLSESVSFILGICLGINDP